MTLKQQIADLKKQLAAAKQHTYIHDTNTLQVWEGEVHIGFGDAENERWLVWNVESIYKDLPFLIDQVVKEQKKQQIIYLDSIKETIKEL